MQNWKNSPHVTMPVTPSLSIGSKKKFITPEWIRGKPPTGVLVAPQTTYHRIRQIASKTVSYRIRNVLIQWFPPFQGHQKVKKPANVIRRLPVVVTRWRFELQTHCLKGNCSANWASGSYASDSLTIITAAQTLVNSCFSRSGPKFPGRRRAPAGARRTIFHCYTVR